MDNHDITVIQVNKNLELHLGYVGGTTTGFDEADPIYTADKPFIALKSEIPTKTSDLQNDSGFISNIPQNLVTEQELDNKGYLTSFTQSDPVYSQDKPNLALKSELYQPKADGDGSKFLADDGTYKSVQSGSDVDLSDYTGNVNLKYDSGNSYLKTSDKTFTLGTQPVNYVSQMNSANINAGDLLTITADMARIMDSKAKTTLATIDAYNLEIYDIITKFRNNVYMNDLYIRNLPVRPVQDTHNVFDSNVDIVSVDNVYLKTAEGYSVTNLTLNFYNEVDDFLFYLKTGEEFSYTINISFNAFINKTFNFEANKHYLILAHRNLIIWSEIQQYVAEG